MKAKPIRAGRGTGQGAGALFFAKDTGRILFVLRSEDCDYPNVWCSLGGGVEHGESLEKALRREVVEEAGYDEDYPIIHMHSDQQGDFTFHNHWAIVPREFTPTLNDEHSAYQWCDELPKPLHPGVQRSLDAFEKRIMP